MIGPRESLSPNLIDPPFPPAPAALTDKSAGEDKIMPPAPMLLTTILPPSPALAPALAKMLPFMKFLSLLENPELGLIVNALSEFMISVMEPPFPVVAPALASRSPPVISNLPLAGGAGGT